MKRALPFLFFIMLCSRISAQDYHLLSDSEKKGTLAARIDPSALALDNANFIYQRCEWRVDPAVIYISGKITTYFIPHNSITQLEFDLSDSLTTDSVLYHGTPVSYSHNNTILTANFPSSIPATVIDSIAVYYHGVPPSTGFGSFDTTLHNGHPALWTLSQPNGASDWWPCKQNLSDKIDSVDIIVTCPSAYRTASNGLLVNEYVSGPDKVAVWKHRYPIATYLIAFAVSNYAVFTNTVPFGAGNVTVLNYVYPEDSAWAAFATNDIIPQMQLYDTLFGAYPFSNEKYGHAECGFGGGMEHQTMTFVGGFNYELMSHELAHHWFGDKVTCASWHDIWLNEGFASYLSGLCYEHYTPNQYWLPFKQGRIAYVTTQSGGTVYCPDTLDVNRIFDDRLSYAKGAMILHTLRWILGDSAWYAGVNAYLNDANCSYGFATTADLKSHFETAGNQNLTWYFNDWFTGAGYPSYTISWDQDAANVATFTVNQSQSDPSVNFFELPLPIEFKDATHDTLIRVQHNFSGELFSVQLSFHADSLLFDPAYWIISANNVVNNINTPQLNNSITVFPNPATNDLVISSGNGNAGTGVITMWDVSGRKLHEWQMTFTGTAQQQHLSVSDLARGTYIIRISTEKGELTQRFIKQ